MAGNNKYTPEQKEIIKYGFDNNLSIQEIKAELESINTYKTLGSIGQTIKRWSQKNPKVWNPIKARGYHREAMQDYSGYGKEGGRGGKRHHIPNRETEIDKIFQCLNNEDVPVMGYDIGAISFSDDTLAIPILKENGKPIDDSYMPTVRDYIKILFNGSSEMRIAGLIARTPFPDSIEVIIEREDNKLLVKPNKKKPALIEYTKIFLEGYYNLLITNQIKTI